MLLRGIFCLWSWCKPSYWRSLLHFCIVNMLKPYLPNVSPVLTYKSLLIYHDKWVLYLCRPFLLRSLQFIMGKISQRSNCWIFCRFLLEDTTFIVIFAVLKDRSISNMYRSLSLDAFLLIYVKIWETLIHFCTLKAV